MATADKITVIVEKTEIVLKLSPDEAQALRNVLGASATEVLQVAGVYDTLNALRDCTDYSPSGFKYGIRKVG
jgi:hypothetical protein